MTAHGDGGTADMPQGKIHEFRPYQELRETQTMRQLRQVNDLIDHAESLYETCCALDIVRFGRSFRQLPQHEQSAWRYQATAAVAAQSPGLKREAELRAREHVALRVFRRDYSRLSPEEQAHVNHSVSVAIRTYGEALMGLYAPLADKRRAELEPVLPDGAGR